MRKLFKIICIVLCLGYIGSTAVASDEFDIKNLSAQYNDTELIVTGDIINKTNVTQSDMTLVIKLYTTGTIIDQEESYKIHDIKAGESSPFKIEIVSPSDLITKYTLVVQKPAPLALQKPASKVKKCIKAKKLISEYQANEVRAVNKYKDKIISIEGTITDINEDWLGNACIVLDTWVFATLRSEKRQFAANSNIGDHVSLKGKVGMCILGYSILLSECH